VKNPAGCAVSSVDAADFFSAFNSFCLIRRYVFGMGMANRAL
jgi:hypothetical protein